MIEKLIAEKKNKLAEYEKIKKTLETEKRTAFTTEEREKVNELKISLSELNEQIKLEEEMETEKRSFVDSKVEALKDINIITSDKKEVGIIKETETEFRNYMLGGKVKDAKHIKDGKFQFSVDYQTEKRATVTTSTNAAFTKTETLDKISIQTADLVLQRAGAQRLIFEYNHGSVKAPSMSQLRGVFVAEGASTSEMALTSSNGLLTPVYMVVPLKVSKQYIATQSAANFSGLISEMLVGIENGLEYDGYKKLSGLTAISTASGSTLYAGVLAQEAAVIGSGSAYIFPRTGVSKAKQSKIGTDQTMVWKDGIVNGYSAYRSSILSDIRPNDCYYGRFSDLALATFGPISTEIITDSTLALAGELLIVVSTMASTAIINTASFSRISNVNQLV